LQERHDEEFRRLRFCAGLIAASVENYAMTRSEEAPWKTALDFVPEWKKAPMIPETDEEMIASMVRFFGNGPGKPN
jgi:hypothetical protein